MGKAVESLTDKPQPSDAGNFYLERPQQHSIEVQSRGDKVYEGVLDPNLETDPRNPTIVMEMKGDSENYKSKTKDIDDFTESESRPARVIPFLIREILE